MRKPPYHPDPGAKKGRRTFLPVGFKEDLFRRNRTNSKFYGIICALPDRWGYAGYVCPKYLVRGGSNEHSEKGYQKIVYVRQR
jgi:hypothetical protein